AGERGPARGLPPAGDPARLPPPPSPRRMADRRGARRTRVSARRRDHRPPRGRSPLRGTARRRALGRLPQRRNAGPQQRVRPRRRGHRLPPPPTAAASRPRRGQPGADAGRAGCGAPPAARLPGGLRHLCGAVGAVFGPADAAQGGRRGRLDHQHGGLRHPDTVCRMGRDRTAARSGPRSRADRVLSPLRRALPPHPDLPARGGHPARRPDPGHRAGRGREPRRRDRGADRRFRLVRRRRSRGGLGARPPRLALAGPGARAERLASRAAAVAPGCGPARRPGPSAGDVPRAGGVGRHRPRGPGRVRGLTPLAAGAAARYNSGTSLTFFGAAMQSAAGARGDHDVTDVPSIVAGAVRLGLFEAVVVLLFSLGSRLLDPPLETLVLAPILLVGLAGVTLLPGLWTRPRTIEGIAGAAGIGLGAAFVFLLIDVVLLQHIGTYGHRWMDLGGGSNWWYH